MNLLRGSQDPASGLHYCFFDCFSLVSTTLPFPSLMSNCLNLLVETQSRSRRLNEVYLL